MSIAPISGNIRHAIFPPFFRRFLVDMQPSLMYIPSIHPSESEFQNPLPEYRNNNEPNLHSRSSKNAFLEEVVG